ncbi:hypothetical protein PC113_g12865 [Phytophthora cactorum]|uniref:Uncharacterized protein n=1 Tax=Phytophthora cactorum TaxID=29920 RepID=A0A8T0YYU3_9STRA|nr:hypothetical protein PC113_g12865 [Phytophthora cactorum]
MSMSTKKAEVLLSSGNYFRWEFNMLMALARMGLLAQVEVAKPENEVTEAWLVKDTKAPGIIAQGVELQHQTKSRKKYGLCSMPGLTIGGSFGTLAWYTPVRTEWPKLSVLRTVYQQ